MADKMNEESAQCDTAKSLSENSRETTLAKSSPEQNVETMGETSTIQSRSKKDKIDDKEQQPLESSKNSLKPKNIDSRDKFEQVESKVSTPKKDKSYRNRKVRRSSESDDERVEKQRSKSPAHSKTRTSGSNETPWKQTRENSNATSRKRSRSRSRERHRDRHGRHPRDISWEHSSKRSREEHSDERSRTYSSKSQDTHQSPGKEKANNSSENSSSPSPLNSVDVKKTPQKTKNESNKKNLSLKGTPPKKEVEKRSRFSPILFHEPIKTEDSRSLRKEDSLKLLKQDWKNDKREHFFFFFGKESSFSNFHSAQFTVDGDTYSCSEQFMMHQKAVLFHDPFHAEQILKVKDPLQMKRFGRKVQNFNADIWRAKSEKILGKGIKAKFMQNKHLKRDLINTFPRILVEASPRDRLWGIGMGEKNYKAQSRHTWRGKNRLGFLLTNIRNEIMEEEGLFH